MRNDDLAPSLEEFGLSKYEARAYIALLSKGPLSASELAYYANLPRTKVYGTLTKLAKKRLAIITQDKPVVCSAVAPEEAFSELVVTQENRIRGMKAMVTSLQKISDEGRKPHGAEERTYLVLDPDSVLGTLEQMISTTRSTIVSTLDNWGTRLISQCKDSLVKALASNVEAKFLISKECANNEALSPLNGIHVRIGEASTSLFIFDKSTIILVNGSNGKGVLFRSADVVANMCNRMFDNAWSKGKDLVPVRFAKTTLS
jgi:sugar-specific transcriptional regulator TrmB